MTNPYRLDFGIPTAIQYSGGRSSTYMLIKCWEAHNGKFPETVKVLFENTGLEREETLEFVHRIETHYGIPVTWLEYKNNRGFNPQQPKVTGHSFRVVNFKTAARKGEPFRQLIEYVVERRRFYRDYMSASLPNPVQRFCTGELKIKTSRRYLASIGIPLSSSTHVLGIRYDEPRRYNKLIAAYGDDFYFPLMEAKVSKPEVDLYWKNNPKLDLTIPSDQGNCNLCFLKSKRSILTTMSQTTEFDAFWLWAEAYVLDYFRRDRESYAVLRDGLNKGNPKFFKILNSAPDKDADKQIDCLCGE
jgi:3'-phosphoadenosine 5'-phosphosulfate sulfotransferase (PAPS reductase)/FAD synthetase